VQNVKFTFLYSKILKPAAQINEKSDKRFTLKYLR